MSISRYFSSKTDHLMNKLSIDQLVDLRSKLKEKLLHYGYEIKYLEDFLTKMFQKGSLKK